MPWPGRIQKRYARIAHFPDRTLPRTPLPGTAIELAEPPLSPARAFVVELPAGETAKRARRAATPARR